jgi:hypothetical protein
MELEGCPCSIHPRRTPRLGADPARIDRQDCRLGATAASLPPPLLRSAGAKGRSRVIFAAIPNGRSWPPAADAIACSDGPGRAGVRLIPAVQCRQENMHREGVGRRSGLEGHNIRKARTPSAGWSQWRNVHRDRPSCCRFVPMSHRRQHLDRPMDHAANPFFHQVTRWITKRSGRACGEFWRRPK